MGTLGSSETLVNTAYMTLRIVFVSVQSRTTLRTLVFE
jgi:hypothetical protein